MKIYKDSFGKLWIDNETCSAGQYSVSFSSDNLRCIIRNINSQEIKYNGLITNLVKENLSNYTNRLDFETNCSSFFDNAPITSEEVDAKIGAEVDILSDRIDTVEGIANAASSGSLGSIKPTDAAPTPARNGNYTFSIGGNKPAWLTAEAGVTEVKAGDGVAVVFTEPSSYSYTHVDTGSAIEQTRSQSTSKVPSSKLLDDELVQFRSDLSEAITELEQEQIQGGVYDVSSHNDGAVFESISTLLGSANLSALIPTSVRRGGMSIRFIQGSVPNSDNKYVQYMYIGTSTATADFTNVDNWEKIENGNEETVKVTEVPIEWINNKYIGVNGIEVGLSNWKCTDFIPVTRNANPVLSTYFENNSSVNVVSFYDEFKVFISGFSPSTNIGYHRALSLDVPTNAKYIRLCISNNILSSYYFKYYSLCHGEENTIQGIYASVKTLQAPLVWNNDKYITTWGAEVNTTGFVTTNFIPINNLFGATIRTYFENNNVYNIVSFYDEFKTYINGFTPSSYVGYQKDFSLDVPVGSKYIRLSIFKHLLETYGAELYTPILNNSDNVAYDVTPRFSQVGFIDNNGNDNLNDNWRKTDYILISNNDLYVTTGLITGSINIISFYNKNKEYISGIPAPSKLTRQKLVIPSSAEYIRYCSNASLIDVFVVKTDINNYIRTEMTTNMVGILDTNSYITSDGRRATLNYNRYSTTDYIYVNNLQNIYLNIVSQTGSSLIYAFYDKNKDFISGIVSSSENFDNVSGATGYLVKDVVVPSNAVYIRLTLDPHYNQFIGTSNYNYWKFIEQVKRVTTNDIMLPKYIDVAIGHQCNLFFDSLRRINRKNEHIELKYPNVNGIRLFEDHLQIEQEQLSSDVDINFSILDEDLKFIVEKSTTIRISPTNIGDGGSKNICIMGDSLIDGTYTPKEAEEFLLDDNDYDFHFLGTRGAAPYLHEGRGGWSWGNYLTPSYNGVTNAFWNTSLNRLDFKNYMSTYFPTLDDKIDIFIACLGTNDVYQGSDSNVDYNAIIGRAKTFIDQLLTDYPDCKVVIGLCGYGAPNMMGSRWFQNKIQILGLHYINNFDDGIYNPNVTTVAHGLWIDRWNSYQHVDIARTDKDASLNRVFTNLAHPDVVGYKQWGDALYAKIRAFLNGYL